MWTLIGGLVILAAAPWAWVALLGAFISGFAFMLGSTELTTTLQELIADGMRGRVMALWSMGFFGSRPLAAVVNGTLADLFSPRIAVFVLAGLLLLVVIAAQRRIRSLDWRPELG